MKKRIVALVFPLLVACSMIGTDIAEAARARVVHRGHRTRVTVRTGFPLHRRLPSVYIRAPRVTLRVAPRVYLPPLVFGAVVVASLPEPGQRVWTDSEELERSEGWTEFTLSADRRGTALLLEIERGSAHLAFAEVVFENGDTQVVDFNDKTRKTGVYTLIDFRDGRKVDHVRVVAKAASKESVIRLHMVG